MIFFPVMDIWMVKLRWVFLYIREKSEFLCLRDIIGHGSKRIRIQESKNSIGNSNTLPPQSQLFWLGKGLKRHVARTPSMSWRPTKFLFSSKWSQQNSNLLRFVKIPKQKKAKLIYFIDPDLVVRLLCHVVTRQSHVTRTVKMLGLQFTNWLTNELLLTKNNRERLASNHGYDNWIEYTLYLIIK